VNIQDPSGVEADVYILTEHAHILLVSCVGRGLAMGRSPDQEVVPRVSLVASGLGLSEGQPAEVGKSGTGGRKGDVGYGREKQAEEKMKENMDEEEKYEKED
jgi:hypothetical protein